MGLETYEVKKVINPHALKRVKVPGSKSITNRALLFAALANGKSTLDGILFSDDSRHFLQALKDLGFMVDVNEKDCIVEIEGHGGKIPSVISNHELEINGKKVNAAINVGSAGTAARFLTAFLGLSKGYFYIDSSEQMKKRPMKELLDALTKLGAKIEYVQEEYHFPLFIGNEGWTSNHTVVDIDKSSQFLSALLIASVLSKEDFSVEIEGHHGLAYVEMTIKMMKQFGVEVKKQGNCYCISKESAYQAKSYQIEPDLSAACYFYAMSPLLQVSTQVDGVFFDSLQGDIEFINVLEKMGCRIENTEFGILLHAPMDGFKGGSFDLSSFSDQALTLAAIAPFANSPVVIENVSHIRFQECDRIHAILLNLSKMGIDASEENGNITIQPGTIHSAEVETFDDHRVAMSFTLPGLVCGDITILDPMCCRKTFETYFDVIETIVM